MEIKEIKKSYKPKTQDNETKNFQHVKIIDCNQPVSRVIFECWHCKQGLLSEVEGVSLQVLEVTCPNCDRTAIRLMANQVLSTTAIPSPWN